MYITYLLEFVNDTITKYNNDIDKIATTISFDMSDSYLSIYDTACKKNNILFKQRSITRTILLCYITICLFSIIPLIVGIYYIIIYIYSESYFNNKI